MIPPPRAHRPCYHGVLAPNARLRADVVRHGRPDDALRRLDDLQRADQASSSDGPDRPACIPSPARVRWAQLLARVYEFYPLRCPGCDGPLRILDFLTEPEGEFRTKDGKLCYPLTIQDGHTRFLFECRAMHRLSMEATLRSFARVFRIFGLPHRIRTDNGHPFASTAIAGISQLSIWWISLGILPEYIEPGKPQQNGRHERMHRTLKKRTASPPRADSRAQQRRLNEFRGVYNTEQPHEALDIETPASVYEPSPRPFIERPASFAYPDYFETRIVSGDSTLRWKSRKVFVGSLLKYRSVALEQIGDGVCAVYFGPVHLGWLDEADYRIRDVKNRARRHR